MYHFDYLNFQIPVSILTLENRSMRDAANSVNNYFNWLH